MNYTQHTPFLVNYEHKRRSVYLMARRLGKSPLMGLFDGPDTNVCIARRNASTVPLQALFMMNSPFIRDASVAFAKRVMDSAKDGEGRIDRAYRLAFARPPAAAERAGAREYLQEYGSGLARNRIKGDHDQLAWASFCRVLLSSSEFVYVE